MRAVFFRKEPEIEANEFCVEKVIVLPANEYESFTKHLMHDYDFIRDNVDLMCEKDGVWHCLLVTGEGMEDGVLVESEGSSYARYATFVPSTGEIIRQYQAIQETVSEQEESGCQTADEGDVQETGQEQGRGIVTSM